MKEIYIRYFRKPCSGVDYGTPYEIIKIHDGILAGFMEFIDEWGRPTFEHIRNLFKTFIFCDRNGVELPAK